MSETNINGGNPNGIDDADATADPAAAINDVNAQMLDMPMTRIGDLSNPTLVTYVAEGGGGEIGELQQDDVRAESSEATAAPENDDVAFMELLSDEPALFQSDVLEFFADKAQVEEERRAAANRGNSDLAAKITERQDDVEHKILGPQEAVRITQEGRARVATELAKTVDELSEQYKKISELLGDRESPVVYIGATEAPSERRESPGTFSSFLKALPGARDKLDIIERQIKEGTVNHAQLAMIDDLSGMAKIYDSAMQGTQWRGDMVAVQAEQGQSRLRANVYQLGGRQNAIANEANGRMEQPSEERLPETIHAVVESGITSIDQHLRGCIGRCETEQAIMSDTRGVLSTIEDDAVRLLQNANSLRDDSRAFRSPEDLGRHIADLRNGIQTEINESRERGETRTGNIQVALDELYKLFNRMEADAKNFDADEKTLKQGVASIRTSITNLRGRALFNPEQHQIRMVPTESQDTEGPMPLEPSTDDTHENTGDQLRGLQPEIAGVITLEEYAQLTKHETVERYDELKPEVRAVIDRLGSADAEDLKVAIVPLTDKEGNETGDAKYVDLRVGDLGTTLRNYEALHLEDPAMALQRIRAIEAAKRQIMHDTAAMPTVKAGPEAVLVESAPEPATEPESDPALAEATDAVIPAEPPGEPTESTTSNAESITYALTGSVKPAQGPQTPTAETPEASDIVGSSVETNEAPDGRERAMQELRDTWGLSPDATPEQALLLLKSTAEKLRDFIAYTGYNGDLAHSVDELQAALAPSLQGQKPEIQDNQLEDVSQKLSTAARHLHEATANKHEIVLPPQARNQLDDPAGLMDQIVGRVDSMRYARSVGDFIGDAENATRILAVKPVEQVFGTAVYWHGEVERLQGEIGGMAVIERNTEETEQFANERIAEIVERLRAEGVSEASAKALERYIDNAIDDHAVDFDYPDRVRRNKAKTRDAASAYTSNDPGSRLIAAEMAADIATRRFDMNKIADPITLGVGDVVVEGQHRAAALMTLYGKDWINQGRKLGFKIDKTTVGL